MTNIYQVSLDAKFQSIIDVIVRELGHRGGLTALTAERRMLIQNAAEQCIINWAVDRRLDQDRRVPITNLQHLLDEYCALADHI